MIKIIISKWIKNYENVTDRNVRESYGVLSGILGILCNLLLFIAKISIGLMINSIAVISDAFNNLTDLGSSMISILGSKLSNRPPDKDHPNGHGRFEYIASLVIAFIIFLVGYQLLVNSYNKLVHPEKVNFSVVSLIILVLSVTIKLWMFSYNTYIGKKINSSINKATAYDSLSDGIATSAVIVTMIIGQFTIFPVDGAGGMAISLLILYSGFMIAKDTINLLLGSAPDEAVINRINQLVLSGRHVIGVHDLVVHDYGPSRVIASVHVEVPDYLNIVDVHSSIDTLEEQIAQELGIEVVIHMDPISTDENKIKKIRNDITACLQTLGMEIQISKFRIAQAENKVNVIMDIQIEFDDPQADHSSIKKIVREKIEDTYDHYEVVINSINILQQDAASF